MPSLPPLCSLQVDTIGQPLSELLHPDDLHEAEQQLESLFAASEGGAQGDFITRMRTTLSTAVRSSSKIQYKVSLPAFGGELLQMMQNNLHTLQLICAFTP